MEELYNQLNHFLKGNTRFGTNETIARYLLAHLDLIPEMKLSEVAEGCNTSTPSVIRFCREIGYEDYTDFKDNVKEYWTSLKEGEFKGNSFIDLNSEESYRVSLKNWMVRFYDTVYDSLISIDRKKTEQLANDILKHRYVYLFATGNAGIICEYLHNHLGRMGIMTMALPTAPKEVPLSDEKDETLSIVFSQHGRLIFDDPDLIPYLEKYSDKVLLITQEQRDIFRYDKTQIFRIPAAGSYEEEFHIMLSFTELLREVCQSLQEK